MKRAGRRVTLPACHPRACPEDPYQVAVDPRDKPEGDNVEMKPGLQQSFRVGERPDRREDKLFDC